MANASLPLSYRYAKKNHILVTQDNLYYTEETQLFTLQLMLKYFKERTLICITQSDFLQHLTDHYQQQSEHLQDDTFEESSGLNELAKKLASENHDLLNTDHDAPIIRLLNNVLSQAIQRQASDIHFDTYEQGLVVRFRIDGILHPVIALPAHVALAIVSRLKVMSKLDIAEKRLPQDGRINVSLANHHIDLRVSTLPINHGERVVLRILDKRAASLNLHNLGMSESALERMKTLLQKPHGVILVTGPTGSGKTTSLYASLRFLDHEKLNIMTVEDPIEFDLSGISQTPINAKIGRTFAQTLRSILRQDPDVIMLGEIRDEETAQIAIQASLTGHLVLSTLHTNTAIGAITRLRDMGVEPFLLASSLTAVIAQRLVRRLCSCKKAYVPTPPLLRSFGLSSDTTYTFYEAVGCEQCLETGYAGRLGIYEVIEIDEILRRKMYQDMDEQSLMKHANTHYQSIIQDGLNKIIQGTTSVSEVMRVSQATTIAEEV